MALLKNSHRIKKFSLKYILTVRYNCYAEQYGIVKRDRNYTVVNLKCV